MSGMSGAEVQEVISAYNDSGGAASSACTWLSTSLALFCAYDAEAASGSGQSPGVPAHMHKLLCRSASYCVGSSGSGKLSADGQRVIGGHLWGPQSHGELCAGIDHIWSL